MEGRDWSHTKHGAASNVQSTPLARAGLDIGHVTAYRGNGD
jgi:hypothetical protein